jgi:DNA-binding response OmpR family regulator
VPTGIRVLLVDDTPFVRELYTKMLSAAGHEVIAAASGREALTLIAYHRPHVVLLDFMMPEMNGAQVLTALRAKAETRGLPVLVLTGSTSAHLAKVALDAGADDFLSKPVPRAELLARVRSLAANRSGMRIRTSLVPSRASLVPSRTSLPPSRTSLPPSG